MCYQRFALCALAGYVLLFAVPVSATLLAADSFVYTDATPLNGSGGGTGFGSNWAGTGSTITAPGATYPGLATAGNAVLLDGTAGYTECNLSAAAGGVTGQSVYVAFTMQLLNGGAEFGGVRFGIPGYFVELGRNPFASYGLRVGFGASIINTGVGPSSTQSDLLMYEFATGAADTTINIWVNPTVGTPLGAPNASTTLTGPPGHLAVWKRGRKATPPIG